jgi:NAD(P)H-dependent FMN reductase
MNDTITIAVIAGTSREGRLSINAAKWVAEQGNRIENVAIIFVDPRDVHLPPDGAPEDGRDPVYAEVTAKADAFFIVSPEYNRSMPGSLKRLLDSEYGNYNHKPVAVAGVSNGPWGGVRLAEVVAPTLRTLGLVYIRANVFFPKVQDTFDEAGIMKPENEASYTKNVQGVFDELLWYARALKAARAVN